jgi:hypothetical protein
MPCFLPVLLLTVGELRHPKAALDNIFRVAVTPRPIRVLSVNAMARYMAERMSVPQQALAAVRFHMEQEHLTPEEVGKLAAKARVKTVVLTHFSPGLDGETDVSGYTTGVRKYFSGTVIAGQDLFEY